MHRPGAREQCRTGTHTEQLEAAAETVGEVMDDVEDEAAASKTKVLVNECGEGAVWDIH